MRLLRCLIMQFVLTVPSAFALAAPPGLTPPAPAPVPAEQPAPQQPPGPPQGRQPGRIGGGPEAIKKRIRALRASTLIDELQLDEATAGKLFPIFGRYDDETEKLLGQRADLQRQLAGASSLKDDKAVNKLIDDAAGNQRAFWELEERRLADLRKVLTAQQAAKLVVVLPALERKIQNQLRRAVQQARRKTAKANGGSGNAGRNPAARDDDDEDDDGEPMPQKR